MQFQNFTAKRTEGLSPSAERKEHEAAVVSMRDQMRTFFAEREVTIDTIESAVLTATQGESLYCATVFYEEGGKPPKFAVQEGEIRWFHEELDGEKEPSHV